MRLYEKIFEIDAGAANEGGEIVEVERESDGLLGQIGEDHFSDAALTE